MSEFNKLVEAYAPGFSGVRKRFRKGDIVKLPIGWQQDRGYFADWARDVTHGEVWGQVVDRHIHLTGDIEVTLLDPETREPLGQGLAFRPDELTLAESLKESHSYHHNHNVIVGPAYSATRFHWEKGEGTCEMSDLKPFKWQRVYHDAEDRGITVHSPKTGSEIVFVVVNIVDDGEDIQSWELESLGPGGRPNGQYRLTIFND